MRRRRGGGPDRPLPPFTANDDEALLEQLAADLWESRRGGTLDDRPWAEAGSHWQPVFRTFARTALQSLGREVCVGEHVRFA